MELLHNNLYLEDINKIINFNLPWDKLKNKKVLISGATGMIGSFLIDVLMNKHLSITIIALGRNVNKAKERFKTYWNNSFFKFVECDINNPINLDFNVDFIIHLASNTHPVAYATDPIGTITSNIFGTYNLLTIASENPNSRFLFASSNEIYGENRGDIELFKENYCGYINSNTLRAGYPESKRCSEALCQAFNSQKNVDFVIARLTRSFGPTLLSSDTKALSQFIKNGINGENIILKSDGTQFFSYTYVADAVLGLLHVLLKGETGNAYNVADETCDITLKDLANLICKISSKINNKNCQVIFELPNEIEKKGFSKATKARLDGNKLKSMGWHALYSLEDSLMKTMIILKEISIKE